MKAFAFGAGAYSAWAVLRYGNTPAAVLFVLGVGLAIYLAGRGFRRPVAVATAVAVASADADASAVAAAQGGSVHLHLYRPDPVDTALGYDRATFTASLRGDDARPALDAYGLGELEGALYALDDPPDELEAILDDARRPDDDR